MTSGDADYQDLADWFVMKVAGYLKKPPESIDVDTPLADCGIDSVAALSLCADLRSEHGYDVDTTIIWDYPTVDAIVTYLVAERAVP